MRSLLAMLLLALPVLQVSDPARQFDFWIGEWSVQNRHLQPDGTWVDGDRTRARITPVCGAKAVLEEWAGPFQGAFMNGFSLRAWDPALEHWTLVLFWTVDGNASFGRLAGTFRHGRGEFFAGPPGARTRYTFSDALPGSVRWDSARSPDGGLTWNTDWIMEFSRTRPAAEVTQDELFSVPWTEGRVSPHAEARLLDWMLGEWEGEQIDAAGRALEARLRCKLLAKDCLLLDLLETRPEGADDADDWDERLSVRGLEMPARTWSRWHLSERDSTLRRSTMQRDGQGFVFEHQDPRDGSRLREFLMPLGEDELVLEELDLPSGSAKPSATRTTRLRRLTRGVDAGR